MALLQEQVLSYSDMIFGCSTELHIISSCLGRECMALSRAFYCCPFKIRPRRDSNSQSSDPKSDALSIRPRGRFSLKDDFSVEKQFTTFVNQKLFKKVKSLCNIMDLRFDTSILLDYIHSKVITEGIWTMPFSHLINGWERHLYIINSFLPKEGHRWCQLTPQQKPLQNGDRKLYGLYDIMTSYWRDPARANLHYFKIPFTWKMEEKCGSGGIRTHASWETGALNQRLRPLGHTTVCRLHV